MDALSTESISSVVGLLGAAVGGLTSMATTWINTTAEKKAARIEAETRLRRELYARYMDQLATMYAHALRNDSINYESLATGYALRGQITLASSPEVVNAAEKALKFVVDLSIGDRRTDEQTRRMMDDAKADVIGDFAKACRDELLAYR